MNKGLVFLVVIAIVGFAGYRIFKDWGSHHGLSTPDKHWIQFIPPNHKFQVAFPTSPHYVEDKLPIPESDKKRGYQIYASEEMDSSVYMLSIVSYPSDYDTSKEIEVLNKLVDELIKKHDVKSIKSRTNGTWEGKIAQEVALINKGMEVRGKAIFGDDKTIYVLVYSGPQDNFSEDEYRHFVDSFHLLPHNKS